MTPRPVITSVLAVSRALRLQPKVILRHHLDNHGRHATCQLSRFRFMAMWLARKRGASWTLMSQRLALDSTSCRYGVRRAEELRNADPEFRQLSDELLAQLNGGRS